MSDFIAYYRVSTASQGRSGLGLDAQKAAVAAYVHSVGGRITDEYCEVESGALHERTELNAALRRCRARKAMLVIAKLDRLARSSLMISQLMDSGIEFIAADMPHANKLTIHIIAAVAEYEREVIAQRTRDSLAAAKARGVRLGNPNVGAMSEAAADVTRVKADDFARQLMPLIETWRAQGITSLSGIAASLENQGIRTQRGGRWSAAGVRNVVRRAERLTAAT